MKSTIKRWAEKIEFMTATYLKKIYKTLHDSRRTGADIASRKKVYRRAYCSGPSGEPCKHKICIS